MQFEVIISKFAQKQIRKLPLHIQNSLRTWAELIENQGQRSSRLSRAYRVIYEEFENGEIEIINVLEVSKHEY